ncbi:transmembrane protein, putative (macronuclear) [Tetrahymena thermophila SB210]|uniref:Transmembrane protein, putative n=1 Tax=Tetrahymena thermophila (strain SB210) TaxID=312017 RepID=W7XHD2_TETTS|nr:transmembrane protein, putative [Tetrahymena thermophila SB210]EWS72479.1 transmembrane protein, putative [Tetrahymena thermophila SB210]|eukprot:XP_012654976.1 transmembrane protein, putative [Tetrahymena thermophila SB210]
MNSLISFIKFADIFGQGVQMNFQKSPAYKTVYGGLVTIIIGCCFISGCYFFGSILINRLDPTIITQERSVTSAARINITNNNIVAMFGVSNGASEIWSDPTIFRMYAVQQIMQIQKNSDSGMELRQLISHNKTMKICEEKDIGIPSVKPYFNKLNLTNLYCLDQGQDIYIEGDFDAQSFAQVFVYVEKCSNGTDPNIICKPMDVINQKLQLSKIQIFLSNTIVDPLNHEDPFSSKGMNLYTQTSSSFPKEVQLYFTNQYIQDDVGFMFREIKNKHSFVFTIQQETSFFSNYNVLVRVLIRLQKQKENLMQRRYQKFQDIVAQIGGLMKLLTTVGSIITYRFTQLYLHKAIGDEVLIYDDRNIKKFETEKVTTKNKKNKTKHIKPKQSVIQEIINSDKILSNNNIQQIKSFTNYEEGEQRNGGDSNQADNNLETKKNKLEKIDIYEQPNFSQIIFQKSKHLLTTIQYQKFFNIIKNKIKYNFYDYFKQLFAKSLQNNDNRAKLVQKGMQMIEQQLDITYIINKLNEIDKLKAVIFNKDQLKIFDCIPKPIVSDEQLFNKQQKGNIYLDKNRIREQITDIQMQSPKQFVYYDIHTQRSEQSKVDDAIQGLQNIINNKYLTKIDKNLIQIIDPNILNSYQYQQQNKLPRFQNIDIYSKSQNDSIFIDYQECIDEKIVSQSPETVKNLNINTQQLNQQFTISLSNVKSQSKTIYSQNKLKQPDRTEE